MPYIHVKKVGNKRYYTLRISYRDKAGRVITKDIENLGMDITKIHFETLERKYKTEIRDSYRTIKRFLETEYFLHKAKQKKLKKSPFFSKEESHEIEAIRLHYHQKFSRLDKVTKREIYEQFLIKFAVSSTSIEGNTINLNQARKLLQEEIIPKNKTLREIYDIQNTQKVFFTLLEEKPELSFSLVEQVHDELLKNIDLRRGYRIHDIHILGKPFAPSPGRYVKDDMNLLLNWYHTHKKKIHPFALALFFHHKFEHIHPFSDGNGRTGRMIINLILLKNGCPPLIILPSERKWYLEVMNIADTAIKKNIFSIDMKYYQQYFHFCIEQYKKSYWNTFLF